MSNPPCGRQLHHTAPNREVRLAPDGAVIVSADYAIVRFDPDGSEIQQLTFALEVADALPGALDPNTPLPGTWLSSIAVDGDHILVGRNNVPYLTLVNSRDLSIQGRIELSEQFAGPHDIVSSPGLTYVLGADGTLATTTGNGPMQIVREGVAKIDSYAPGILSLDVSGAVSAIGATTGLNTNPAIAGFNGLAATTPAGRLVVYDRQAAAIVRLASDGTVESRAALPLENIPPRMDGAGGDIAPMLNDMVAVAEDTVWYVTSTGRSLWSVTTP